MTVRKYTSRSQQTTLSSAVTSGATVIPVTNASTLFAGVTLTAGQTFTVVIDPDTALEEIVDVTSASSNNLTVTRAVDMSGASAQDHSSGAVIRHMIIGRDLRESNLHIEATAAYNDGTGIHTLHGLTTSDGVITGTTATQTLTNKTFTTPVINGATLSGTINSTATVTGGTITGATVTGLVTPTATSDATPKAYVDSILGSAVAAATSAASAAASATAAATSASSAATSASSAATSASSALASQTAAATSATSAAASATAAATSATSSAASATTAATSAGTATTQAAAAATSATSASASATAAATSATSAAASATASATSAASAAASTSAAALSATAAATSATSAAASATNAATSATSAAASATAAATSAASALTSQTAAATSATSSAASATAAATSATSAAASATAAAASFDSFDDRYLGPKSTAPTVDNDGNPLTSGVIYYNTTDFNMYVWNGGTSSWQVFTTTGDITAVAAGTGLTGGGTSGAVTLNLDTSVVIQPSAYTAKGVILVGTGTGTYVSQSVGSNGQVLTANSAQADGVEWTTLDALPSQTGNSGKYLTTNGTAASWSTIVTDPTPSIFMLMGA